MRARPGAYDNELHYGEGNRRRASQFLGLSENAIADRPGRRWARGPEDPDDPDRSRYAPEETTGELPIPADVFGVAAESPGVAQQPLAPWMTGEHQAISLDEVSLPTDEWAPEAAPPFPPPAAPPHPPPSGRPLDVPGAPVDTAAEPPVATPPTAGPSEPAASARGSMLVAAGILLSRCAGLLREVVIAAVMGNAPAADAFKAALRIPNLMQNLLGEGVLSASFIPVYARLRAEGRHEDAGRLAGAIAGLLAALTGVISVIGVLFAGPLTSVLAPGFTGDKHDLTVTLTRIMFPGIGFLVLSAWCLGVLNSHKQFFLSYVAPVLWNVAQIAALVGGVWVVGGNDSPAEQRDLAIALSWGVFIGGILQFGVQIRPVRRLLGELRISFDTGNQWVRSVINRFVPVLLGRGAIQIMGWIDLLLASFLVSGAIATLSYTMVLYLLPISLFGVSVAAAELPNLSQVEVHDPDTRRRFRLRLEASMGRIAWYVAFTATMFIVVGDVIVAAIFERGSFDHGDTVVVWVTLAVLAVGLLPVTASRLLQNGLYALDDPRTPARLGVLSVVLSAVIGVAFMFPLDRLTVGPDGIEGWGEIFAAGPLPSAVRANPAEVPHLGIVGLAIGSAVSRWVEYRLLSNALAWRVGRTKLAGRWLGPIAIGCAVAAAVSFFAEMAFTGLPDIVEAALVVGAAGLAYLGVTHRLGVPEAQATASRLAAASRRIHR
jgi:putative peptidoglycan lipid II flippase